MLNYSHLQRMTDEVGMLQFSRNDHPDPRSGYTLDDNARALLVTLFMGDQGYPSACHYMNFLSQAQRSDGTWSNFLQDGKYSSSFDSEDSWGRAIMACSAATISVWPDLALQASQLIRNKLEDIISFSPPRAVGYSLVGLCKGKIPCPDKQLNDIVTRLSAYLIALYNKARRPDWLWFEDYITYCNAILPHALFSVYSFNGDRKCFKIAHESINFLNDILFRDGYLNIIGNQGWYHRRGSLPLFDQQPVDAASTAFACWEAYQCLGKNEYLYLANLAYQWFRGQNIHGISLYNEVSGGCYDALTEDGVNSNQGAESIVSLLLTELLMDGSIRNELKGVKTSWGTC